MPRIYKSFRDIPQFTKTPTYKADISLSDIPRTIKRYKGMGLNTHPDFQRGHVWTVQQQIKYIEFLLSGGTSGSCLYFNHPGWMNSYEGDFVLVDGLQRITAITSFLDNKLPVFGTYRDEYIDKIGPTYPSLQIYINNLKEKSQVLKWYIEMNSGGVVHSDEEIDRVKKLLEKELAKK